jgi:hypothetical protein
MLIIGAVLFIALLACWFALPVEGETSTANATEDVKA